ncbi:MAG: NUDIX hydrolase [Bdellovibrionales bacterium]
MHKPELQINGQPQDKCEPKYVKVIVFDDQNRVLLVKNGNRLVLPGGPVEWDDDDTEAAARREVFEAANIALGTVTQITVITTKDPMSQTQYTAVYTGRTHGKERRPKTKHRFLSKDALFKTVAGQGELVRALIESAHRVLVTEEIEEEHNQETQTGTEKYNIKSIC